MWLVFRLIDLFFFASVAYLDEFLTSNNSTEEDASIHRRVGPVIMVSTLLPLLGLLVLSPFIVHADILSSATWFGVLGGIAGAGMYTGYFYCLEKFPVQSVVPMFVLTVVWVLLYEVVRGASFTALGLVGVIGAGIGGYLLDAGFNLRIPRGVLLAMAPTTAVWATSFVLVEEATTRTTAFTAYWFFLAGVLLIGLVYLVFVHPYRESFFERLKAQRVSFGATSLLNESLAMTSFFFQTLALATAPFVSYVAATSGISNIYLLGLLFFFPLNERSKPTRTQITGIVIISVATAILGLAS